MHGGSSMSTLANQILGLAQTVANIRGSKLRVKIDDNHVKYWFESENSETRLWESHYPNVAFYYGDSAVPVKFDFGNYDGNSIVNALENAVTTEYYKTVMQQTSIRRMFNIEGAQQETMLKILYVLVAANAITLIMLLAQYGGA